MWKDLFDIGSSSAFVGSSLAFVGSIIALIVGIIHSKKTTFIDTVTIARKDYIDKLRESVAEFCAIANAKDNDKDKLIASSLKLKLMMNPAGFIGWWDDDAVTLIDEIVEQKQKQAPELDNTINKFVALMQSWLALEWHGRMNEGKLGILKNSEKDALRKKFYLEYQKYINYKGYE
jgi:heme exporter protein D